MVLLGSGFVLVPSGGGDDSHITYWSAHALAHFGKIVNYNGEPIEQSSSLATTAWLALLHRVTTLPLPLLGYLSSVGFAAATVVSAVRLARATTPMGELVAPLLATASAFLFWSTSGMETTLTAFAAVTALLAAARFIDPIPDLRGVEGSRPLLRAVLATALFVAARPEGPLIWMGVMAAALAWYTLDARRCVEGRGRLRRVIRCAAWSALPSILLFAFRKLYFGQWFPNPVQAKSGGFGVEPGFQYLWASLTDMNPLFLPVCALGFVLIGWELIRSRPSAALVLSTAFVVIQLAFVVEAGGDWMPNGRFVAQMLPVVLVLAVFTIERVCQRRFGVLMTCGLLVWMNVAGSFEMARDRNSAYPGYLAPALVRFVRANVSEPEVSFPEIVNKAHLRDVTLTAALLDVIEQLHPTSQHPITMMSGQAGMVPYHVITRHYGAVRFIDMFSLTTDYFLRCVDRRVLSRSALGSAMPYEAYFTDQARLQRECGVDKPTIIFSTSLRPEFKRLLAQNGYAVVFNQTAELSSSDRYGFFRGAHKINTFIAVLEDRTHGLSVKKPELPRARFTGR